MLNHMTYRMDGQPDSNSGATAAGGQPTDYRWAGKFKDEKELERAYSHQMTETNKIIAERDKLKNSLDQLMPLLESAAAGGNGDRISPASRVAARQGFTIPQDFDASDPNQLQALISNAVRNELAPITSGIAAQQTVARENPNYLSRQQEVAQFLAANPSLDARVQRGLQSGDPELATLALDHAVKSYELSLLHNPNPTGGSPPPSNAPDPVQAALNARLDAMLPGGAGRGVAAADERAALAQQYLTQYQATGNNAAKDAYLALALDGVVPPEHLGIQPNTQRSVI